MMTTIDKVLLLKGVDLFSAVAADELAGIARIAEEVHLDAGEWLMREGEHGDALYFVVAGTMRVSRADRVIAEIGEREVVGELALLDPGPRTAGVEAVTDTTLLRVGRDDFVEILATRPEVPLGVIKMLARRVRTSLG
ncbi:MAG TPA: cyclic nucleotide-binding domain-containing protein [Kofleriaceae bacterium]|nr:cyclic nucleotide-binding domain-containing protein [Kofleriaceae bacterium]